MTHHYTPIKNGRPKSRMPTARGPVRMWAEELGHCWWDAAGAAALESRLGLSYKMKPPLVLRYSSVFTPRS